LNNLIAYCGLDCHSCPVRLATLETNELKQKEMRLSIVRICAEQYSLNLQLEEVTDCDGCRSNTGRLFSSCLHCEIRSCAINRKLQSCAYCDEYNCHRLQNHFKTDPSAEVRLQAIRSQLWRL